MALHKLVVAAVALLLFPVQYLPDFYTDQENPVVNIETPIKVNTFDFSLFYLTPIDLVITITLVVLVLLTHFWEWIQMKVMERRILKLNHYLCESVERLRALDAQQEQQEVTLKMVENATSEYNLLLYLLLHQHRSYALTDNENERRSKSF